MPVHNCPNCSYTSHRPFDLRRHLRRKIPCNLIGLIEANVLGTPIHASLEPKSGVTAPIGGLIASKNGGPAPIGGLIASKNGGPAPIGGLVASINEKTNALLQKGTNKCDKCEKCFFNNPSLIRHRKACRGLRSDICKICLKRFNSTTARATHNRRVNCKPPSIQTPNIDTTNCIPESSSNPNEFIYLIQLREFVRNNEPVYKIGRTKQSYEKRIRSYPRGSSLFFYHAVDDCVTTETNIKQYLSEKFTQRRDLGLEYFEGDCKLIMKSIKQFL